MVHILLVVIYLSFISLGLPDSLLGSAWPIIYPELGVSVSNAGIIAVIMSGCTMVSSLVSSKLLRRMGTGTLTAVSALVSVLGLFGFSTGRSFPALCLWAIPYGLGSGCVDAALNNYVALHYPSRHMNWLHCMWGVGTSIGPYIFGFVLAGGGKWFSGYRFIGALQAAFCVVTFLSLPLWKKAVPEEKQKPPMPIKSAVKLRGAKALILMLFTYCAIEQTAGLWASSYLVLVRGLTPERAAFFGSLFYTGITLGRALSGFMTIKFSNARMIVLGSAVIATGVLCMLLPFGSVVSLVGFVLIGFGCAPIYPCILHSTPSLFGEEASRSLIGIQMAFASAGSCIMPPLFGLMAKRITAALMPWYLLLILAVMLFMHRAVMKIRA